MTATRITGRSRHQDRWVKRWTELNERENHCVRRTLFVSTTNNHSTQRLLYPPCFILWRTCPPPLGEAPTVSRREFLSPTEDIHIMIDDIITTAIGIFVIFAGFGKITLSKNPEKNQEYLKKYGAFLRIGGIVLTTLGLLAGILKLFTG